MGYGALHIGDACLRYLGDALFGRRVDDVQRLGLLVLHPLAADIHMPGVTKGAFVRGCHCCSCLASSRTISAPFSAIMMTGAFVLPEMSAGMLDASTMRSPPTPRTRRRGSTTDASSAPERKRGVKGKSVSVRVDPGGR